MIATLQKLYADFVDGSYGRNAPNVLVMNARDHKRLDAELDSLRFKPKPVDGLITWFRGARVIVRKTYAPPHFALRDA